MRQRAGRRGIAGLAVCLLALSSAAPARAQTDPDVSHLMDQLTAVRRELDAANAQLMSTREQQGALGGRVQGVQSQIATLREAITGKESEIAAKQGEIDGLIAQRASILATVRARAAQLYVARQPASPLAAFVTSAPMMLARRAALSRAVARRDEEQRNALKDASDKVAVARDELGVQRDELAGQQSQLQSQEADLQNQQKALADLNAQIQSQQAALDARAKDVQSQLQAAIAAGVIRAGGPSLMGPTNLSAGQMAAWWRAQGYSGYSVSVPIEELAQIYYDEATSEGVRGDLAFAQAIIETGGFRYTNPGNNFAGMGWCDSCAQGRSFPTPRDGVRAQIQHLKNYGDPTSRAARLAHPASVYWYAPVSLSQTIANENFDSFFAKGWALTWNQMGNGNWATDPGYADKVLRVYSSMVGFAQGA